HLLLSHGEAVPILRAVTRRPIQVGITLNLQPVHPAGSRAEDQQAAGRMDLMLNRWYLDPVFRAAYPPEAVNILGPLMPVTQPDDLARIAVPVDFLGVNYYSRLVVRDNPNVPLLQAEPIRPEGSEYSLMWEVYPAGLRELLQRLQQDYHPPAILITENGIPLDDAPDAQGQVLDPARISYLRRHLAEVHHVLEEGIPVRGYFVWSFLDNFEWALGYQMRFGLVYVDFATQKRIPKASARWFHPVVRAGSVSDG
ncbi:MAG: family 1 glycosylhydrolase, partial [Planctomycetes bacterium]|nr:family 1 glycosylhydrolase [Planctomycetota bacterium]